MTKILLLTSCLIFSVCAEPPAFGDYLYNPPATPSQQYVPPDTTIISEYLPPRTSYGVPDKPVPPPPPSRVYDSIQKQTVAKFLKETESNAIVFDKFRRVTAEDVRQTLDISDNHFREDNNNHNGDEWENENYEFSYAVDDPEYGDRHGQQESRNVDFVQGSYYVLLPDGRTQRVDYTADNHGFHPKVSYD